MFICKICGLIYPNRPTKCLNDGYEDFNEVVDKVKLPQLALQFSEKQENIFYFSQSSLPLPLSQLDSINKFYYSFVPNHKAFLVKMRLTEIFPDNEVFLQSVAEDLSTLKVQLISEKVKSDVFFKGKNKTEFIKVTDFTNPIILRCYDEEFNKSDELIIKNIIIKYLGVI